MMVTFFVDPPIVSGIVLHFLPEDTFSCHDVAQRADPVLVLIVEEICK